MDIDALVSVLAGWEELAVLLRVDVRTLLIRQIAVRPMLAFDQLLVLWDLLLAFLSGFVNRPRSDVVFVMAQVNYCIA